MSHQARSNDPVRDIPRISHGLNMTNLANKDKILGNLSSSPISM